MHLVRAINFAIPPRGIAVNLEEAGQFRVLLAYTFLDPGQADLGDPGVYGQLAGNKRLPAWS